MTAIVRPVAVVTDDQQCNPNCIHPEWRNNHYNCFDPDGTNPNFVCECDHRNHPILVSAYFPQDYLQVTEGDDEEEVWQCDACYEGDHTGHSMRDPIQTIRRSWNPR